MQKRNRMFYRWLAVMVSVALLIGQGSFSVMAEESGELSSVSGGDAEYNVKEEPSGEEIASEDAEAADSDEDLSQGGEDEELFGESNNEEEISPASDEMFSVSDNDAERNIYEEPLGEEIVAEDAMGAAASVESPQMENGEDYDFLIGDGRYKIWRDKEVELAGVTPGITGEYIIPAEVEDPDTHIIYTVKRIGNEAFKDCENLTSVDIPNGVTYIGMRTFVNCTNLTSINIPDSVTSIDGGAFYWCTGLTSIDLPDSITYIEDNVFYGCTSLTSINIPDGVTRIGHDAFHGCVGLTSINIPDGVTRIGHDAFHGCAGLTSINIPDGVTEIASNTFYACTCLTNVSIPDSVTNIGYSAFHSCVGLTSINIPDGVTEIYDSAFCNCGLTSITIPDGVKKISAGLFGACINLTSVNIPESVTEIGFSAFHTCTGLTSIQIPDSVVCISVQAFMDCTSLTSITIPNKVKSIEFNVFSGCTNLVDVNIPEGVTDIGEHAFWGCQALESLTIPSSVNHIGERALARCYNLKTLRIAVKAEEGEGVYKIKPISLGLDVFSFYESDKPRTIIFLTEDDTTELSDTTSPSLAEAQETYRNVQDGDTSDNYWYGWYLGETPAEVPATEYNISYRVDNIDVTSNAEYTQSARYVEGTGLTLPVPSAREGFTFDGWYRNEDYTGDKTAAVSNVETGDKVFYGRWIKDKAPVYSVTVQVYMDNEEWTDHDRAFVLYQAHEDLIVDNLSEVGVGTYEIYDVTGTLGKSFRAAGLNVPGLSGGLNTGVTVEVKGGNASAKVDYYTATFYDGEVAYGEGTPQRQQIILKGYPVSRPENPTSADVEFQGWMTEVQGGVLFDFAQAIQEKTAIYASWKDKDSDEDIPGNSDTPGGEDTPSGDDNPDDSNTSGGTDDPGENDASGDENNNNSYYMSNSNIAGNGVVNKTAANDKEPKTGDTSHVEIYATIAMIAGLLYVLLYFADRERGMTEEEKNELVSAMIRWAKRGGRLRRYAAIAVIFCLLCYYHSIGHGSSVPKAQAA